MTTHLEEVVSNYEDKFSDLIGAYDNAHLTYESIRNFIIKSHIKYLESEADRLELLEKGLFGDDLELIIDERIRKQQELLQAKELLK